MAVWYGEAAVFLARPADEGVPAGYVEEAERSDGTPMAARAPGCFADRPLGVSFPDQAADTLHHLGRSINSGPFANEAA